MFASYFSLSFIDFVKMVSVVALLRLLKKTPPNNSTMNFVTDQGETVSVIDPQCRFRCRYCLWDALYNERLPVSVAIQKSYTLLTHYQKCGVNKCDHKIPFLAWMDARNIS
jgi:hypothetical protein